MISSFRVIFTVNLGNMHLAENYILSVYFPFGGILENTNLLMRARNYFPIDGVYGKFSFRFCKLDRKIIPDDLLWFAE